MILGKLRRRPQPIVRVVPRPVSQPHVDHRSDEQKKVDNDRFIAGLRGVKLS